MKLAIKTYLKYELLLILNKTNSKKVITNMFNELGIKDNPIHYLYIFNSKPVLRKDIFRLIKNLKHNYKTALLSDNFNEMSKTIRTNLKLKQYFDLIIFSNEVHMVKRESKIYKFIIRKLKCKPKECIFIDDKRENIKRAKRMGINGILFRNIKQLKKDLRKIDVRF